ncbi:MAG TPA: superoxide dismutase family protein [Tepidisphaeraceae bacterium]|nr:superoxide dismutase family protein [Tepidisphaeraceae bacterium]
MKRGLCFTLAGVLAAAVMGCEKESTTTTTSGGGTYGSGASATTTPATTDGGATAQGKQATATLQPSKAPGQDNVAGKVTFTQEGSGLRVKAEVTGLTPNGKHGFHIHEKADLSAPDLMSVGGHFNPGGHKHGGPEGTERHGGDLGNLEADADGKASYDEVIQGLTLNDPKTGVIGKSVIVHEKEDDLKSDPSGNSGARIAGGVIQ